MICNRRLRRGVQGLRTANISSEHQAAISPLAAPTSLAVMPISLTDQPILFPNGLDRKFGQDRNERSEARIRTQRLHILQRPDNPPKCP